MHCLHHYQGDQCSLSFVYIFIFRLLCVSQCVSAVVILPRNSWHHVNVFLNFVNRGGNVLHSIFTSDKVIGISIFLCKKHYTFPSYKWLCLCAFLPLAQMDRHQKDQLSKCISSYSKSFLANKI